MDYVSQYILRNEPTIEAWTGRMFAELINHRECVVASAPPHLSLSLSSPSRYAGQYRMQPRRGFSAAVSNLLCEWDGCLAATLILFKFGVQPQVHAPSSSLRTIHSSHLISPPIQLISSHSFVSDTLLFCLL